MYFGLIESLSMAVLTTNRQYRPTLVSLFFVDHAPMSGGKCFQQHVLSPTNADGVRTDFPFRIKTRPELLDVIRVEQQGVQQASQLRVANDVGQYRCVVHTAAGCKRNDESVRRSDRPCVASDGWEKHPFSAHNAAGCKRSDRSARSHP